MNERDWVPCHRRLLKGAKKGLPRAVRFVLLELCHEARPTGGILEFPPEWETLTAVHDRIGGNRKEIRKALTVFQIPDADGLQVIQIERDETKHRLKIVKWGSWAGPKSGAERNEDYKKRHVANSNASPSVSEVTPTVQENREQERRGSGARASEEPRTSERRLKSVPPPAMPSEAAAPVMYPSSDRSGDAATRKGAEPGAAASGDTGWALAWRVFSELWAAKYHRPYEHTGKYAFGPQSEDEILKRLGRLALSHAEPEKYLRAKVAGYLRDKGDREYLVSNCHPLRTVERDWHKYPEPKAIAPPRMPQESIAEPVSITETLARAQALARAGGSTA